MLVYLSPLLIFIVIHRMRYHKIIDKYGMYKCSNFHRLISDGVVFAIDIEAQLHQFSIFFKTFNFS